MKQNKKAKIYAVFCFAGKKQLLFYIYAVIVKQIFYKRPSTDYSPDARRLPFPATQSSVERQRERASITG
jgi:hypothetical protein